MTDPLRREVRRLQPLVEGLRRAACLVEKADVRAVRRACDDAHSFLTAELIPHVVAQSVALADLVDSEASALSRDCRELVALTHDLAVQRAALLGHLSAAQADELRRVLFSLYALARLQFVKAEEVYLPMVEAERAGDGGSAAAAADPAGTADRSGAPGPTGPTERANTADLTGAAGTAGLVPAARR